MNQDYEERYKIGNTPWDHGLPDRNLMAWVDRQPIGPCTVLDIGCGTGENVVWLAQQGFVATGYDLSTTAIARAKDKATAANVDCAFHVADFLGERLIEEPFDFAIDRGCMHGMEGDAGRREFAKVVAEHLTDAGLWLSLIGNADDSERESGPPQFTACEVAASVEPYFEILSIESGDFRADEADPPRAWICLMRKRVLPFEETT